MIPPPARRAIRLGYTDMRNFAVVAAAKRDGELVTRSAPECLLLREPKMVRIRRLATTFRHGRWDTYLT